MHQGEKLKKAIEERYGSVNKSVDDFEGHISRSQLFAAVKREKLLPTHFLAIREVLGIERDFFEDPQMVMEPIEQYRRSEEKLGQVLEIMKGMQGNERKMNQVLEILGEVQSELKDLKKQVDSLKKR